MLMERLTHWSDRGCTRIIFPGWQPWPRSTAAFLPPVPPSERVFITGGNIIAYHQSALKTGTVEKLLFLAKMCKQCTLLFLILILKFVFVKISLFLSFEKTQESVVSSNFEVKSHSEFCVTCSWRKISCYTTWKLPEMFCIFFLQLHFCTVNTLKMAFHSIWKFSNNSECSFLLQCICCGNMLPIQKQYIEFYILKNISHYIPLQSMPCGLYRYVISRSYLPSPMRKIRKHTIYCSVQQKEATLVVSDTVCVCVCRGVSVCGYRGW